MKHRIMMPSQTYEVIIAGAGPAGSSAAAILGKAGKSVLLVDKGKFPREKTCGDGMTYKCVPLLEKLGLALDFRDQAFFHSTGYSITFSDGTQITVRRRMPDKEAVVYMMPRFEFDNLLFQNARRYESVQILEESSVVNVLQAESYLRGVQVSHNGHGSQIFTAPLVIDASGVGSKIALQLGLAKNDLTNYALTIRGYFDEIDGLGDVVEFVFDQSILPGYFWIFPLGPASANVGCGTFQHLIVEKEINLRHLLEDFIRHHPAGRKLQSARLRSPLKGGRIPLGMDFTSRVRHGVLFCGDAAGFTDPITAEGISFAVESGMLAGETALEALNAGDFGENYLQRYDARWQASFGERFSKADFVQNALTKEQLVEYVCNAVANHPALDAVMLDQGSQYEWIFKLKALLKAL
jgi:geranylgeranyl reductase family protein